MYYRVELQFSDGWCGTTALHPTIHKAFLYAVRHYSARNCRVVVAATGRDVLAKFRERQFQQKGW